jgi:uncharacterized damage-inducible protein DinB
MDMGQAFIDRSRYYLTGEYLPKLRRALAGLAEEDLWWRPSPASNSIGNLLLHLAGNARQWVVSGIGGTPDLRRRDEEFGRSGGMGPAELLGTLEAALEEVDGVLARLPAASLPEPRLIQGFRVTVFEALYHVVEHFAMHTGQILLLSKQLTGRDLGFYRNKGSGLETTW